MISAVFANVVLGSEADVHMQTRSIKFMQKSIFTTPQCRHLGPVEFSGTLCSLHTSETELQSLAAVMHIFPAKRVVETMTLLFCQQLHASTPCIRCAMPRGVQIHRLPQPGVVQV